MADRGVRKPVHLAARTSAPGSAGIPLVAIPVLRGETMSSCMIDVVAVRKEDDNFNQLYHIGWHFVFVPTMFPSGTIDTAWLQASFREAVGARSVADSPHGEPNPGGAAQDWADISHFSGTERIWGRELITRPRAITPDTSISPLNSNPQGRPWEAIRKVLTRRIAFKHAGVLILGFWNYGVTAQTDFGVAEIDTSIEPHELLEALTNPTTSTAQSAKAAELFYGGDTYIEADTLKNDDFTAYALVAPTIVTPWPVSGRTR